MLYHCYNIMLHQKPKQLHQFHRGERLESHILVSSMFVCLYAADDKQCPKKSSPNMLVTLLSEQLTGLSVLLTTTKNPS